MPRYNCIVWVNKKVDGDEIPLTRFTMMMGSYLDVVNKVVEWFTEKYGWDDLDSIVFGYDEVEENTDEFKGV